MYNQILSVASVLETAGYILCAILVLLVMITVHELGHYISGKIFGFGINEFAIGFGPKLFNKTKSNGEVFSVRALPLGGFCSFKGEDEEDDDPSAFNNKRPWQRIIVLISGAFMNYLLAVILICIMFGCYGKPAYYVSGVADGVIVSESTLNQNDVILSIDGKNTYVATDIMKALKGKTAGQEVTVSVLRNGKPISLKITLHTTAEFDNVEQVVKVLEPLGLKSLTPTNVKVGFFSCIGSSFDYSIKVAGTIFTVLGELLTGKLALTSVGGTVTTVGMTATAIKTGGMYNLLMIASYIGVNLAVFNLLPIPALDGSRVVFTAIEWIRRKPISRKVEAIIHFVGLIVLFGFAILVDVLQLI